MTATIAYDRPVKNYIDQLSATGHVTHIANKKKSVTLHHNAARLSHEGVLAVWRVRPASAHFDVDGRGLVCQYVKVNEYAWAVGNTTGNKETISIEMANATLSPDWQVADVTWKSAARLAAWLFWKVIGERPSKSNLFYHHKWSATACAGPYMDKIYNQVLIEAQRMYDTFKAGAAKPKPPASKPTPGGPTRPTYPPISVDGDMGPATIAAWQRVMKTVRDGELSKPSMLVRRVQQVLGFSPANQDGLLGPITWRAIQRRLGVRQTGVGDAATIRALQRRLNTGKF